MHIVWIFVVAMSNAAAFLSVLTFDMQCQRLGQQKQQQWQRQQQQAVCKSTITKMQPIHLSYKTDIFGLLFVADTNHV